MSVWIKIILKEINKNEIVIKIKEEESRAHLEKIINFEEEVEIYSNYTQDHNKILFTFKIYKVLTIIDNKHSVYEAIDKEIELFNSKVGNILDNNFLNITFDKK
ncbi:MAG: hypothetical protein PUB18_01455 [bacterium]|nr:hypothetical protein [bacterium]